MEINIVNFPALVLYIFASKNVVYIRFSEDNLYEGQILLKNLIYIGCSTKEMGLPLINIALAKASISFISNKSTYIFTLAIVTKNGSICCFLSLACNALEVKAKYEGADDVYAESIAKVAEVAFSWCLLYLLIWVFRDVKNSLFINSGHLEHFYKCFYILFTFLKL